MRAAVLTLLTLLTSSVALADDWAPPVPRLYASAGGAVTYGFKVLPTGTGRVTGELFRLAATGATPILWRAPLRNLPLTVLVSPDGAVVTLDTYGGAPRDEHALVLYSPAGRVLADLPLTAVVPVGSDVTLFQGGLSGRFLTLGYEAHIITERGRALLALKDPAGRGPVYDLTTGRRVR